MGMMIDVLIALAPVVIFAIVKYSWHAVVVELLSVFTMCLAEFVFVLIKNWGPKDGQKHSLKEKFSTAIKGYGINNFLVPCVSAVIFAMLMPAQETNPSGFIYFVVVIGALFGMHPDPARHLQYAPRLQRNPHCLNHRRHHGDGDDGPHRDRSVESWTRPLPSS